MQNSRIRTTFVATAVSGLALAASLAAAGPAHADAVIWNCNSATGANSSGTASGYHCTPNSLGNIWTGIGDLDAKGVIKAECTGFNYVPDGTAGAYYVVWGHGCS